MRRRGPKRALSPHNALHWSDPRAFLGASLLELLPEPFRSIAAFVVVLGVLIFIHELGHYLAARWRGVHVERFSVGFGRAIYTWSDKRGCEWRIGWLPLGGYVKMHGMEDLGEAAPEQAASFRPGETFHEKPVGDRALVVAAGPFFNFALAVLLFAALFVVVGRPSAVPTVGNVVEASAAARAGLASGDRIIAMDGQPVERFEALQRYVQARPGQAIEILVARGESQLKVIATPQPRPSDGLGMLGITAGAPIFEKLDPFSAVWVGVTHTLDITWQTLVGVWQMISGSRGAEDLGGPLRIAQMSGQVANMGFSAFITFTALLSVNLALINLFPIPVLDGGHLLFYAAEAIRGRPLPLK
ncbi:MAG: RIP metalloprotease RseP, partial [Roseomonas sp.]|nr:RIP metalloprotease RseP [Roseomonas sp.]